MFHFSDSLCVDQKPQRATTEIWTSNDVLLYFLTMDNGSLNTNGTGTQREARMCRGGGWRESSHYHRMGCITSVEKILSSVAKLLLAFVENIWGPCKPVLRWEKIRADDQFSPRKKYYHQLNRNKCVFLCFSNPFHNRKLTNNSSLNFLASSARSFSRLSEARGLPVYYTIMLSQVRPLVVHGNITRLV